jgi:disulfide bond formation protein DsbB
MLPSIRLTSLILAAGCLGLIVIGLYMQYVLGLHPCALCITQRIFIIAVGLTAFTAFIHNAGNIGRRVYAGLGILLSVVGGYFSSHHMWLQSLPADEAPACGPGLDYILDTFPLQEALTVLLRGDGNCAEVVWSLLGLSIAGWTLVAFIGLALLNLWQLLRKQG